MFRAAVLTRHRVARVAFSLTLSREYFHGCVTVFLRILFSASPRLSPPLGSLLPLPAHHPGGGIWALAPPPPRPAFLSSHGLLGTRFGWKALTARSPPSSRPHSGAPDPSTWARPVPGNSPFSVFLPPAWCVLQNVTDSLL
uniref:Uncharacterized protein n=1 Tax=Rousettus aegyptiacus TaxID=9407 RepID=A0A7J8B999_ROUAE|nr:hypothetical protein HJG63_009944 [Rousettus aegyptiacus]